MQSRRRVAQAIIFAGLAWLAGCGGEGTRGEGHVRVFAAASLIDVMEDVGGAWERAGHAAPLFTFGPTSQLAVQLEAGAAGDVFVSADEAWMDEVEGAGLIDPASRSVVAGNALVVVVPQGAAEGRATGDGLGMLEALGDGRLVLAEAAVPAGRYAREALEATGAWEAVEGRVVYAPDVRAALRFVELGEAAAGVVYRTDAIAAGARVRILAAFPAGSHTPIKYPAAAIAGGEGRAFVEFLAGKEAQSVFSAHGFTLD